MTDATCVAELRRRGVADVDDSTLARALYSSDASLYRVVPQVVARPRHPDELLAVLDVARTAGVPLTMRGAGTSIAGNAVGTGHRRRHRSAPRPGALDRPGGADRRGAAGRRARRAAARRRPPHGLRFGPDPSTHTRCTSAG